MSTTKPKRVALFVESHEGYGHFNIVSQLARKLQDEGVEVMVLSGTLNYAGAAETFNFKDARIINLPLVDYKIKQGSSAWDFVTPQGQIYNKSPEYIAQRKEAVKSALRDFKPDIVLAEFFPFSQPFRRHDMEAIEELYADMGEPKPESITLCRDIVHNSNPQMVLNLLHRHFDRLVVRGDANFSQLKDSQPEWEGIHLPIDYMGNYITAMPEKDHTIDDAHRHVVVFGGGGYYPKDLPFYEGIVRARASSLKYSDKIWDIYVSENMRKHMIVDPENSNESITAYDYLVRLANSEGHGNIRVFEPIDSKKFRNQLANAALVITRGGYNTTFEIHSAGVPQLVIPRASNEQRQRANRLFEKGMAEVFPPHPIEETKDIGLALRDIDHLSSAIDRCGEIKLDTQQLNNHGAATTAQYLVQRMDEINAAKKNNLLIVYHSNKLKKHDAEALAENLRASGNTVTLADVEKTHITNHDGNYTIAIDGQEIPLSQFDAATLRTPVEVAETQPIRNGLKEAGIPIFQDYPSLVAGHDKMLSQKVFENSDVPAPRTFGTMSDERFSEESLSRFIDGLGHSPYVVKACKGWNGNQVRIVDSKEEAIAAFREFHAAAEQAGSGGALVQEFIDSDPDRKSDYRVQTVAGIDAQGNPKITIVGAVKRVAQKGMLITNVSQGADMQRVSLSEAEARAYYVDKLGMQDSEFKAKLTRGEIEILSDTVADAAMRAARAFGSGCMGVDIVADIHSGTAKVLEVNPFAGLVRQMEEQHGFPIHAPWAKAFEDFATAHRTHVAVKEPEFLNRFDSLATTTPPPSVLGTASLIRDGRIKAPAGMARGGEDQ